jgi:hypothetical protein
MPPHSRARVFGRVTRAATRVLFGSNGDRRQGRWAGGRVGGWAGGRVGSWLRGVRDAGDVRTVWDVRDGGDVRDVREATDSGKVTSGSGKEGLNPGAGDPVVPGCP